MLRRPNGATPKSEIAVHFHCKTLDFNLDILKWKLTAILSVQEFN